MQHVIITVMMAADVFIALLIVALVLVQQSKEGALGSPFGGMGESVFGAHATGHLTKLTVVCSILFLSITLALAIIIGHRAQPVNIVDRELAIKESQSKNKKTEGDKPESVKAVEKVGSEIPTTTDETLGKAISDEKTLSPNTKTTETSSSNPVEKK